MHPVWLKTCQNRLIIIWRSVIFITVWIKITLSESHDEWRRTEIIIHESKRGSKNALPSFYFLCFCDADSLFDVDRRGFIYDSFMIIFNQTSFNARTAWLAPISWGLIRAGLVELLHQLHGGLASHLSQSHLESQNKDRCLDTLRAWLDKLEMIYGFGGGGVVQIQRQTAACADMALCSLALTARCFRKNNITVWPLKE